MGKDEQMQKVFKRLFLRLSLTVITPILLLICAFLFIMESFAADDYIDTNSKIASSVCESVNAVISARTNFAYSLRSNYSIEVLAANVDETISDTNAACKNITNMLSAIQDPGSIFSLSAIYFPQRDIVVSSRSIKLPFETFFSRYLGFQSITPESLKTRMLDTEHFQYIPSAPYAAETGERGKRITLILPIALNYTHHRAILLYVVDEEPLRRMITNSFSMPILYRMSTADGVCLSKSDELADFTPSGTTVNMNGQKHYLFTKRFSDTGIIYEILIPSSTVLRMFHTIEIMLLTGMLLCLTLGILIAKKTTRRIYHPFENLMAASFPDGSSHDIRHMTDGLQLVTSRILTERSQTEKLRAELTNYYRATRENALILLITQSEYLDANELEKLSEICELPKPPCHVQLALIKAENQQHTESILSALSVHPYVHTARLSSQRIAAAYIHHSDPAMDEARLSLLLESFEGVCEVAVSSTREGLRALNACLNEAAGAFSGSDSSKQPENASTPETTLYPLDKELNLIALILNGRQAEVLTLFSEIMTANRDYLKCTQENMALLFGKLLKTAEKAAKQMQSPPDISSQVRDIEENLLTLPEEAPDAIEAMLAMLCEYALISNQNKNQKTIQSVRAYIEENYADPNLCLDIIADHLGVSYYFLSRIFYDEAKTSFSDMMNDIRISHALTLLTDSRASIQEIAEKTGYTNLSTFLRAFKKRTGTTPTRYRNGEA